MANPTGSSRAADSPRPDFQPVVSVLIPVWNVEPYLRQCLDSVLNQSIGLERLEVIAVDDGSTDGSGALLDEYAARYPQMRVIHQPNSGGPGRPRNVGLDHSSGTFVFFLDADDYLGREALERLVAMAERNSSDVVLGKMVGIDGRPVPTRAFRRSRERADLEQVYSTLGVLKLFRRSLIERLGLRFAEGVPGGEDGPFTQRAYLEANVISVVADYDCYYCRRRADSQTKISGSKYDLVDYLARRSDRIERLVAHRGPHLDHDQLMSRHIWDVVRAFSPHWLALEPTERQRIFDEGAVLIKRWNTDSILARLSPSGALRAFCLQHDLRSELEDIVAFSPGTAYGEPITDGRRVFARFPHFRDGSGIPDVCFELTSRTRIRRRLIGAELVGTVLQLSGEAYLTYLGGTTTIVLRRWPLGPEHRFSTTSVPTPHLRDRYRVYPDAGFALTIDLATCTDGRPLKRGVWEIWLAVQSGPVQSTFRLKPAGGVKAMAEIRADDDMGANLSVTPRGDLRLSVGAIGRITKWLEQADIDYRIRRIHRRALRLLRRLRHLDGRQISALIKRPAGFPGFGAGSPRRSRHQGHPKH